MFHPVQLLCLFVRCFGVCGDPRWLPILTTVGAECGAGRFVTQAREAAIASVEVSVDALVLYGDHIFGHGQNTVLRDTDGGAQAEVNTVTDALRRIGRERFAKLDRDSLLLLRASYVHPELTRANI